MISLGIAIVILLIGLFHALAPRAAWFLSIGWKIKDGEPSDLYIGVSRLFGWVAVVITAIVIIVQIILGISSAQHTAAWVSQYKSNLTFASVMSISDGRGHELPANQENTVLSMLQKENMSQTNPPSGGYSGIGELDIQFRDGQSVTILNIGGSSWLLGASGANAVYYVFDDESLVEWYQSQNWGSRS